MTSEWRPDLCYVLPRYDAKSDEHFAHTYGLLRALADRVNLAVIVERGAGAPEFGSARVVVQHRRNPVLRFLEIAGACHRLSRAGCRRFFVRYSFFGALAAWMATRRYGGHVFYWHCTSMVFKSAGWSRAAWRQRLRAELPLALTMRLIDYLVTGTPSLARFYHQAYGIPRERIRVIPNDIDPARFARNPNSRAALRNRLNLRPDQPVVLYVHRVVQRKGAHYLPEIMAALVQRVADVHLVVVGQGPLLKWLREAMEADPLLRDRVTLVGSVPNAAVPDYYSAADVFLMPSQEEGFPRVLLECMASGLPFVASDVGGVRDLCQGEQLEGLVGSGDVEGYARRVCACLRDEALRERLRETGYHRVQMFGTSDVADLTVSVLGLAPHPAREAVLDRGHA